jgi:hypothetical protein
VEGIEDVPDTAGSNGDSVHGEAESSGSGSGNGSAASAGQGAAPGGRRGWKSWGAQKMQVSWRAELRAELRLI